jgi:hypothetical protein
VKPEVCKVTAVRFPARRKVIKQKTKGFLSEPVPYPGREEVWPGLGIYIHPVVQQVPGWIGRGRGAD